MNNVNIRFEKKHVYIDDKKYTDRQALRYLDHCINYKKNEDNYDLVSALKRMNEFGLRKIPCIKFIRNKTNWPLKSCIDFVNNNWIDIDIDLLITTVDNWSDGDKSNLDEQNKCILWVMRKTTWNRLKSKKFVIQHWD